MFKIVYQSKKSAARLSELQTPHGKISGPFFMPIATRAAVKNISTAELESLGAEIILSNTYHLMLTPGIKVIKKLGGLHRFMNWPGPILTDSGGFQVFSLSNLRQISEHGVTFADPRSGAKHILTPESSMDIQADLGVDIAMAFDQVEGYPATKEKVKAAANRTTRWAKRCQARWQKKKTKQLLFGIIQGGVFKDLRLQSVCDIVNLNFDGYAVGGVAVGEPRAKLRQVLNWVMPQLPAKKPRYLMGLGRPEEIVTAVKHGIDMFDCVIPTREARHGRLYLWSGKLDRREPLLPLQSEQRLRPTRLSGSFYETINITNAKFATDRTPINSTNLKQYSRAYLHHLFKTNEALGLRLATLNNLEFYLALMQRIRHNIKTGVL